MKLTAEELAAAERAKLMSLLDDHDLAIMSECERVEAKLKAFHEQRVELQDLCKHPLPAREVKNKGNTGNWDGHDTYWTDHHCTLCNRRWSTTQRWKYVGGKLGLPDDEIARNWES